MINHLFDFTDIFILMLQFFKWTIIFHHFQICQVCFTTEPCGSDGKEQTCSSILVYMYIYADGITTHLCDSEEIRWPIFQTNTQTCPYISVYCPLNWECWDPVFVPIARMCVCMCVFGSRGLACWLPEATTLKCVKWGSSQRWALGYEAALKSERVFMDVCACVCVTYISDICQIHWHISWCEWHWACRPSPSVPSPPYSPWHGTVLHLVYRVMRETDETEGGFEVQSGVKHTRRLNYSTWGHNTTNTVHHLYVFVRTMISSFFFCWIEL